MVDGSSVVESRALLELFGVGLALFLFLRGRLRGDKCGELPDWTEDDELWGPGSPRDGSRGDLVLDAMLREGGLI
jgi:hypothetical protein